VNGALATTVYGESFPLAVLALVVGNLAGAVCMALHAAQGPRLGIPQLVQTRAQFGRYGALLVIAPVVAMYIGFLAASLVLAGQALNFLNGHITVNMGIIAVAAASVLATVFGYPFIHEYARVMTVAAGAVLMLAFAWIVAAHHLVANFWHAGQPGVAGFMGTVTVAAVWQIAYAPCVSDYSRYLPADTSARQAFWASYAGTGLGSILPMILGAMIGIQSSDVLFGLNTLAHGSIILVVAVFTISMVATSAMNVYSGALALITVGQAVFTGWLPRAITRAVFAVVIAGLAVVPAIESPHDLLVSYIDYIVLLMYVVVPWTAINLTDFYLIRRGDYDVRQLFLRNGAYGRLNLTAVFCYLAGIACEAPFVNTVVYEGPMATSLKGVDISWIICLAVTSPLYYLASLAARRRRPVLRGAQDSTSMRNIYLTTDGGPG
jgi:NCS1 family nucleobase:cation symporter-1